MSAPSYPHVHLLYSSAAVKEKKLRGKIYCYLFFRWSRLKNIKYPKGFSAGHLFRTWTSFFYGKQCHTC